MFSPVIGIGAADVIVAFEKMEAVRYSEYLKPDGIAIINDYEIPSSTISSGLAQYPEGCIEAMQEHFSCHILNAANIASELGNTKCMNLVLFGSLVKALNMENIDWEEVITQTVPEKSRALNIAAYQAGYRAI